VKDRTACSVETASVGDDGRKPAKRKKSYASRTKGPSAGDFLQARRENRIDYSE